MIISKLSIVLHASGPVSCDEVRLPTESKPLITPVGGYALLHIYLVVIVLDIVFKAKVFIMSDHGEDK
jgi:hypothetical protein